MASMKQGSCRGSILIIQNMYLDPFRLITVIEACGLQNNNPHPVWSAWSSVILQLEGLSPQVRAGNPTHMYIVLCPPTLPRF